jgi:hypothetical protein
MAHGARRADFVSWFPLLRWAGFIFQQGSKIWLKIVNRDDGIIVAIVWFRA